MKSVDGFLVTIKIFPTAEKVPLGRWASRRMCWCKCLWWRGVACARACGRLRHRSARPSWPRETTCRRVRPRPPCWPWAAACYARPLTNPSLPTCRCSLSRRSPPRPQAATSSWSPSDRTRSAAPVPTPTPRAMLTPGSVTPVYLFCTIGFNARVRT